MVLLALKKSAGTCNSGTRHHQFPVLLCKLRGRIGLRVPGPGKRRLQSHSDAGASDCFPDSAGLSDRGILRDRYDLVGFSACRVRFRCGCHAVSLSDLSEKDPGSVITVLSSQHSASLRSRRRKGPFQEPEPASSIFRKEPLRNRDFAKDRRLTQAYR